MAFFSKDEINSIRNATAEEKQKELLEVQHKEVVKQQFIDETTKTLELFLDAMKEFPSLAKAYGREPECLKYPKKGLLSAHQSEPVYKVISDYYVTLKGVLVTSSYLQEKTKFDYVHNHAIYFYSQITPVSKSAIADTMKDRDIGLNNNIIRTQFTDVLVKLMANFTYNYSKEYKDEHLTYFYNMEIQIPYEERVEKIKTFMKNCCTALNPNLLIDYGDDEYMWKRS